MTSADELQQALEAIMNAQGPHELLQQVFLHPILETPQALDAVSQLIERLRQEGQDALAEHAAEQYEMLKSMTIVRGPARPRVSPLEIALQAFPDEIRSALQDLVGSLGQDELVMERVHQVFAQHPVLFTPQAIPMIHQTLDGLRQAGHEDVVEATTSIFEALIASISVKQAEYNENLFGQADQALMQADSPIKLQAAIAQYPTLLEDETLNKLAKMAELFEQKQDLAAAQRLLLLIDEIKRIRQQRERGKEEERASQRSDEERVLFQAESGGIAVHTMYGDINQIENYAPPLKGWQRPRRQTLGKTFIGRKQELDVLRQYLTASQSTSSPEKIPIAILQGMGGIGKTHLALKLAMELQEYFPGGIIRITLGPQVTDQNSAQVALRELASYTFNGVVPIGRLQADQVAAWLEEMAPGQLLVIIDDVWHQAPLRLLNSALPHNAARLVTTRYANVAQLLGGKVITLERLSDEDSLALLEDRLGNERIARDQTEFKELVKLLDGHALALDIIASLISKRPAQRQVSLDTLRKNITRGALDGLKLPPSNERDESLEKSFALSYEHMTDEQQRHFRALGVFAVDSPITVEAAADLWGMEDQDAARQAVFDLVDLAMLTEIEEEGESKYSQHSLLRAYARVLLDKNAEMMSTSWAHAQYYKRLIFRAQEAPLNGFSLLDQHIQNLLVAAQWALEHELVLLADILDVAFAYFWLRGQISLLEAALPQAVLVTEQLGDKARTLRASFLVDWGDLDNGLGKPDQARVHYKEALALYRAEKEDVGAADTLKKLGDLERLQRGDFEQAYIHYNEALALYPEQQKQRSDYALLLKSMGDLEFQLKHFDQARAHYNAALPICHMQGDDIGEAHVQRGLGELEWRLGNSEQAHIHYDLALALYRARGHRTGEANTYYSLGNLALTENRLDQARIYYDKVLAISQAYSYARGITLSYLGLGQLEERSENLDRAMELYTSTIELHQQEGNRLDEAQTRRWRAHLASQMGDDAQAQFDYTAALALYRSLGDKAGEASVLDELGYIDSLRGNIDRGISNYETALSLYRSMNKNEREANTLNYIGELQLRLGNLSEARASYETALSITHSIHYATGEAEALRNLGDIERRLSNYDQAHSYYDAALSLYPTVENHLGEANLLWSLGELESKFRQFEQARTYYDKALLLHRSLHHKVGEANDLKSLGDLEKALRNYEQARGYYDHALPLYRSEEVRLGEANLLFNLGNLEYLLGKTEPARACYDAALPLFRAERNRLGEANVHWNLGDMAYDQKDWLQAKNFYEHALSLYKAVGDLESARSVTWSLAKLYVIMTHSEHDAQLFSAFINVDTAQELQKVVKQNPSMLSDQWFALIEELITSQEYTLVQSAIVERFEILKQIRYSAVRQDEQEIVIAFINADWFERHHMVTEHEHLLLDDHIEEVFTVLLGVNSDPGAITLIKDAQILLQQCRKWGVDAVWYFRLSMRLGADVEIPSEYEPAVMHVASLLSQQYEDRGMIEQAVKTMHAMLDQLTANMPVLFEAALLFDLAETMEKLSEDSSLRRQDLIDAFYSEALSYYQTAGRTLEVDYIEHLLGNSPSS